MKRRITVRYECEVCHRRWRTAATALACEASPGPVLVSGDVVIWQGNRDSKYGRLQTLVYDQVAEVSVSYEGQDPGHSVEYSLMKDWGVNDDDLPPEAESGYVTVIGHVGIPIIHTDQLHTALRDAGLQKLTPVVKLLRRAKIKLQPRVTDLYQPLVDLEYSLTWSQGNRTRTLRGLPAESATVLAYISREPTDDECLAFIGGKDRSRLPLRPKKNLADAFDYNTFTRWGGLVRFDMDAAYELLATRTDAELIALVRAYRADLLRGTGTFINRSSVIETLFPLDQAKSTGAWSPEILAWVRAQRIIGTGQTRLRRVYEDLQTKPGLMNEREKVMLKKLSLWRDKSVLLIAAGKGGVGKSTITADLARALAAHGKKVLVFDGDFYGPSMPTFFPVADPRLKTHAGRIVPHLVDGVQVISIGHLLKPDEPLEWRGPYLQAAIHMLGSHLETEAEVVLVDMPPGTGDSMRAMLDLCPSALVLFVATAGPVALSDVRRAINVLDGEERSRIIGLVDNMAYLDTPGGERVRLWGGDEDVLHVAREYHLRCLGALPLTAGNSAQRQAAVAEILLPPVEAALAGQRYQNVDPGVITTEANRILADYGPKSHSAFRLTWTVPNLAGFLEGAVRNAGGNPKDPQYHPFYKKELTRLLADKGIKSCLGKPDEPYTSGAWWGAAARKAHGPSPRKQPAAAGELVAVS